MKFPGLEKVGPTETIRRELRSLDRESDPELYFQGLLTLGSRLAQRGEIQAAHQLFQTVKTESREACPDLADRAGREIEAIEGRGAFGQRVEFLGRSLFREAASPSALIGMAGAQAVFGLARAAFFSRLTAAPTANFLTRGFGAQALASTGAFALEAPSFVAFTRGANAVLGVSQDWSSQALSREVAGSFLTLGALKLAGWAGGSRKIFTQASMLGGIMLGHRLEELTGLRAPMDGATTLTDSLAVLLQFNLAGRLLGSALGPRWASFNRELHFRAEGMGGPMPGDSSLGWGNFVPATATVESPKNSNILLMQGREGRGSGHDKDPLATAPLSVKELIEEARAKEKASTSRLLYLATHHLLRKDRNSLSPKEKEFLLAVANRQLDEYRKVPHSYYLAMLIFPSLHNFPGLRRLAGVLEDNNYDKYRTYMLLENYERALASLDAENFKSIANLSIAFHGMGDEVERHLQGFASRRGYDTLIPQPLDQTALDLSQLSSSYDLVVAIAKGGLFSGAMAEFLGLPVRVIEVHAHNREEPISKFVDEIRPEDIAGKRVLFVDKDTISGASIREAIRLIEPYRPSAVGVYFNHDVGSIIPERTAKDLRAQGFTLHFPNEVELFPSLPLFYQTHEKLGTPLGRFRKALRGLEGIEEEKAIRDYIDRQQKAFFAFNPLLPGVDAVRSLMASRLEVLLKNYLDARTFDEAHARDHLIGLMKIDPPLPAHYVAELANARYSPRGNELAKSRGVENIHVPHSYVAAFRAAQNAVKDKYDVALIVGPEGFAYEPIFKDLGLETVAVNIPEADFGGNRSIAIFNDLSKLRGKRVLVVEDDVQSGATLQKLLKEISPYQPGYLGLYLGLPALRQMQQNIPEVFNKIYLTEDPSERDNAAFLKHLKKREVVFKHNPPRGKI